MLFTGFQSGMNIGRNSGSDGTLKISNNASVTIHSTGTATDGFAGLSLGNSGSGLLEMRSGGVLTINGGLTPYRQLAIGGASWATGGEGIADISGPGTTLHLSVIMG